MFGTFSLLISEKKSRLSPLFPAPASVPLSMTKLCSLVRLCCRCKYLTSVDRGRVDGPFHSKWLIFFHDDPVSIGVIVMTDSRHLPGNLHARLSSGNPKRVPFDFLCHVDWGKRSNRGQLIPEILVQSFEIIRQLDCSSPLPVKPDDTIVNIHHVWRLNKGV